MCCVYVGLFWFHLYYTILFPVCKHLFRNFSKNFFTHRRRQKAGVLRQVRCQKSEVRVYVGFGDIFVYSYGCCYRIGLVERGDFLSLTSYL